MCGVIQQKRVGRWIGAERSAQTRASAAANAAGDKL
jgi:hypothetical protein